jgi:hypothetical protein
LLFNAAVAAIVLARVISVAAVDSIKVKESGKVAPGTGKVTATEIDGKKIYQY